MSVGRELAMGWDLLAGLVRMRETGARGHRDVFPSGVRRVLKEVASLQRRT
jgi:hypothetical protein